MDEINVWGLLVTCYLLGPSTLQCCDFSPVLWFDTVAGIPPFQLCIVFRPSRKGLLSNHKIKCAIFVSKNMALHRDYLWLEVNVSLLLVAELGVVISFTVDHKICYIFYLMWIFFLLQDLITAPTRLAPAKPVWPVWAEDRGATQSSPPSALWNRRQPRSCESLLWRSPNRQGRVTTSFFFLSTLNSIIEIDWFFYPSILKLLISSVVNLCSLGQTWGIMKSFISVQLKLIITHECKKKPQNS